MVWCKIFSFEGGNRDLFVADGFDDFFYEGNESGWCLMLEEG
jgi:hypothetical protein